MIPIAADPIGTLVFFIAVFGVVGVFFLFIHMVIGKTIRPSIPDPEKLTIYECGEPTVGSAWIQFDLRFYVVALLFVVFDVEVAFFFPWATVFGKANQLANMPPLPKLASFEPKKKPTVTDAEIAGEADRMKLTEQLLPSGFSKMSKETKNDMGLARTNPVTKESEINPIAPEHAAAWARIAFWDILVFFGVLMVGFAYVWRRGDIDWVRAYHHHEELPAEKEKPLEQEKVAAV